MVDRPPEQEPAAPETASWIDDEMRADSSVWETIEQFGTEGKHPRFTILALLVDPIGFDVESNPLTNREYFEFIRFEVAEDDGTEPIRGSVNRCNEAWKEMMLHARVGFNPDREDLWDYRPGFLEDKVKLLPNRESVLFGLALTFQLRPLPERETSQSFENACREFDLSPIEQRGIARLTAKTKPDEMLRIVLLAEDGMFAQHLADPDGKPDLTLFGGPDWQSEADEILARFVAQTPEAA